MLQSFRGGGYFTQSGVTACMSMQSCTFQFILKPFDNCIHRIEYLNKYKKKKREIITYTTATEVNEVYKATKDRKSMCPSI